MAQGEDVSRDGADLIGGEAAPAHWWHGGGELARSRYSSLNDPNDLVVRSRDVNPLLVSQNWSSGRPRATTSVAGGNVFYNREFI